jgi:hypothetical protein
VGYSTYAKNRMLNTWRNVSGTITTTYASLHTGDPGDTGASEVTGGSPAYGRKAITWNAAASGSMDGDAVTFDVPAGTITHVGYWDASTSGNYLGSSPIATVVFAGQDTYRLDDLDADLNS